MNKFHKSLLAFFLLIVFFSCESLFIPKDRTISGIVRWDDSPLENVRVYLTNELSSRDEAVIEGFDTTTDVNGQFTFIINDLPSKKYAVNFETDMEDFVGWTASELIVDSTSKNYEMNGFLWKNDLLLISPGSVEIGVALTPILEWTAYPGALHYILTVVNIETSETIVSENSYSLSNYTFTKSLEANSTYLWIVEAVSSNATIAINSDYFITGE